MSFIYLFSLLCFSFFLGLPTYGEIILSPGKVVVLPAKVGLNINIETGKLVSVKDLGQRIEVKGRQIGQTQIRIGETLHDIQIVSKSAYETYAELEKISQQFPELKLLYREKKIYLSGMISSLAVWQELQKLPPLEEKFHLTAQIDPALQDSLKESIAQTLKQNHLLPLSLAFYPQWSVLLPDDLKDLKKRYEETLNPLGLTVESDNQAVFLAPLIRIKVIIAEIKKGLLQRYGLQPPTQVKAQIIPKFAWKEGEDSSLLQLDFLESQGQGKVLSAPNLLSRSGKKASFMAGGEIPIRSGGLHSGQVVWKKYGILLEILPILDAQGAMSLDLSTEVSSPDYTQTVEGLPGLAITRLSNFFVLEKAKSVLLSGLIKREISQQRQGWPLLSQIPILGPLFSSRQFQNEESELIILVIPEKADSELPIESAVDKHEP